MPNTAEAQPDSPESASRWRIVIVGATAPARLVADEKADVRPVRTTFEALGLLAEGAIGPEAPVVLVSASASLDHEAASEFVAAARRLDPAARLGLLRTGAAFDPAAAACFDFEVWMDVDAAGIRRAIAAPAPASIPAPLPSSAAAAADFTRAKPRPAAPSIAPPAPSATPSATPSPTPPPVARHADAAADHDFNGERAVIEAMLSSGDVLGPALDHLRRSLPGMHIDFIAVIGDDTPEPRLSRGQHAARVAHRDRTFAFIIGPVSAARQLDEGGAWLGAWLALREQHASLKHAAFTDPLTGAWNRRYFDRFLSSALATARAKRRDVSILLFDIDNFKSYNDRWGHPAGDDILRETVRLLNSVIRPSDRVCRIGGDEFAVIFDEPQGPRDPRSRHPSSILDVARRFQKQIESTSFPKLGADAPGRLTISGGMATYPWDAADADTLVAHADRLVLESKRLGKNAICIGPDAESL